jgi:arginine deiminase
VLWVPRAKAEHDMFCEVMRERGVKVFEAETLLAETLAKPEARDWVCGHILSERQVGITASRRALEWVQTARRGCCCRRCRTSCSSATRPAGSSTGVTINPMTKPARMPETMIMEAIYRFHPMFTAEKFPIWLGGTDETWGRCHVEGGDVQPIGNGTVMIGMGERTTPQAVTWIARSLFRAGSAMQVLAVHLPKSRSYMHLDTVITMCDRDLVTLFPQVVYGARTWSIRPGESAEDLVTEEKHGTLPELMAAALGLAKMRVVETGGDAFEAEREQWDDGNNVVALEPGVVVGYERTPARTPRCARPASR